MLFNSALYGVFLLGAYVVFWLLRKREALRATFLILASYVFYFYGTWDAATEQDVPLGPLGWATLCLGIIFLGSSLDFWIGIRLAETEDPHKRKGLLLLSIGYYLGVLAVFKYFNFGADTVRTVASWFHLKIAPAHLRLVLPFGISFFTFETMSYTIDVYRREIEPSRRYRDYLLFVCFFPHLVAGPIVRPSSMLPQLARPPAATEQEKLEGLFLIATGLGKKILIGDTLSVNLVGRVFDNPERYSSLECLVAIYAYAIQIYADFSGYSDVAIGSARLFGYTLPQNFDAPYTSLDLQEFWRRWHISLSSWLRDYLYVPLGGNRHGTWKTYRNLFLTMVLGGLWHGASWNFVLWGTLHGAGLGVNRAWQRWRDGGATGRRAAPSLAQRVLLTFVTFQFVCFCWVFFRAQTFGHAVLLLSRLGKFTFGSDNLAPKVVAVLLVGFVTHFLGRRVTEVVRGAFVRSPALVQGVVLAVCAYALHLVAGAKAEPFVYGQF